ncbi:G-type lectin S-receptor-like serine/threonine-protein kinase SD2-5 isoform X1 [Amaranthus tricolor]|uniref:G-type lectin S-receptor-like serine/threonine-protein kinase SD2-5 isoform X1 n=2 Tax=Amaranthus tricolor TaxID=29722 RepID=UPI00258565A6|nr:G-type lectin S-receptor-like serine/threonine-protein kinase SD2-5 isoform X1 [Amaranthus tricolor]
MGNWGFLQSHWLYFVLFLAFSHSSIASIQQTSTISIGFQASQMSFIDNNGYFLLSNDTNFALGFNTTSNDVTLFMLVIMHQPSSTVIWTANRATPVKNSDPFLFDTDGKVSLRSDGKAVWEADTGGKLVSVVELQDSGNLVMFGTDNKTIVWESFKHPTDTLILNQDFLEGMVLSSNPNPNKGNLTYKLEIKSGGVILSSGYKTPLTYWSLKGDSRKIINNDGLISLARIESNAWKFYDKNKALISQLLFPSNTNPKNSTPIAVLGYDGFLVFDSIPSRFADLMKIPSDPCGTPEPCDDSYGVCSNTDFYSQCPCPPGLAPQSCKSGFYDLCRNTSDDVRLVSPGDGLNYFALGFAPPSTKTDLAGCKDSCSRNCSCHGLFYDNTSRNCFVFDRIGSFISDPKSKYTVFIKVSMIEGVGEGNGNSNRKHLSIVIVIVILTVLLVAGMIYGGCRYYKTKKVLGSLHETSEEDNFLESLSGMPVRFSYQSLQDATNNFSVKLGQGGFGSVYQGKLPDGTLIAVKKLEGVGQGKKEFRAEVSIIGSIHHIHLVRLKGFCTEGSHRLLAYEFMANGSLDKWIFKRNKDNSCVLDWATRFNIAVGTAKGLAYLHEDCEVKIVHCDIKPENVLLDEHFEAKVSDFGLAKLMTREQSHVFTTLRGTRGYLAPEWITNYAISEKSDVYSYGMVLLEIIGGRKNFDPSLSSEKSHFPAYAFKMMEEGKLNEILDSSLKYNLNDESVTTAIKVALWCIQEDMSMRPPMTKVVQMLEGISFVPEPPTSSLTGARLFSTFFKLTSSDGSQGTGTGSSSGPSEWNSDVNMSAVRLSGPR